MKTKDQIVDTLYGRPVYQKPDGTLYQIIKTRDFVGGHEGVKGWIASSGTA